MNKETNIPDQTGNTLIARPMVYVFVGRLTHSEPCISISKRDCHWRNGSTKKGAR